VEYEENEALAGGGICVVGLAIKVGVGVGDGEGCGFSFGDGTSTARMTRCMDGVGLEWYIEESSSAAPSSEDAAERFLSGDLPGFLIDKTLLKLDVRDSSGLSGAFRTFALGDAGLRRGEALGGASCFLSCLLGEATTISSSSVLVSGTRFLGTVKGLKKLVILLLAAIGRPII
jgi:hypothetical protein